MGVNSLPKTVTRQRRDCDLNPGPTAPESSTLTTRLPSHPERVVNAWNSLPRDTNFNSVAVFKRSIAKVDFTTFLKSDFMLS